MKLDINHLIEGIRNKIGQALQSFGGWIAKEEKWVMVLLHQVNPLLDQAEELALHLDKRVGDYKDLMPHELYQRVDGFLQDFVTDSKAVQEFMDEHDGVPPHTLLENAVALAVQHAPQSIGKAANLIMTAVNVAVSVIRAKQDAGALPSTPQAASSQPADASHKETADSPSA